MTLFQVVTSLKNIALRQPNVRTARDGSVYLIENANPSVKYVCVVVSQTSHREEDDTDYYGFNIFYVDRLNDTLENNRLQIQSIAKETLSNIIKTFCDEYDADYSYIRYTPFTQKFKDECAGMYASVELELPRINCYEEF